MALEIRTVSGIADLERYVALRNDVFPDDPENVEMMALVRATGLDHLNLLALADGNVVGTAMMSDDPSSRAGRAWVEITVPLDRRGRGIGTALLGAVQAHARELGRVGLDCEAREDDPYSVEWLRRRGFEEAGRTEQLALDLPAAPARQPAPAGVELTRLSERPDLVSGLYDVAREVFPDFDGPRASQAESLAEWQVYELGDPGLMLELTPVALAGGRVVGYATMLLLADRTTGVHRTTAVRRDWRSRGVGEALIRAVAGAAADRGMTRLVVWASTDHNGELFSGLGYVHRTADIAFRGPPL